ncbi:Lipase 5 [Elasticomyces elasticus]|nr:Lipase 5 [Elasticomyces elasticus]
MSSLKPSYTFTIPCLHDDKPLDCRIYHPTALLADEQPRRWQKKAAVVAHPYAPMGGCYDDPVVLAVANELLDMDYVVGTFNFRGASNGKGRTSWTGRGEQEDFMSFVGLLVYYLDRLHTPTTESVSTLHSRGEVKSDFTLETALAIIPSNQAIATRSQETQSDPSVIVLAGYSYGSLILSQLPPMGVILQRFSDALPGSAASEILLRSHSLSSQTNQSLQDAVKLRGRQLKPSDALDQGYSRLHSIVYGGEETDPSLRRRSQESRRSVEIIRRSAELPLRLKAHMRRHSSNYSSSRRVISQVDGSHGDEHMGIPLVRTCYILISPLLPPLANILVQPNRNPFSPSTPMTRPDTLLQNPTLVIWGSSDTFTSSRKLRAWADKMEGKSTSTFTTHEIEGGGHFWKETKMERELLMSIRTWLEQHVSRPSDARPR